MRLVLDVNVIVSALMRQTSPPGQLLKLVAEGTVTPLINREYLDELTDVGYRQKFRKYFTRSDIDGMTELLIGVSEEGPTRPRHLTPHVCRDPNDDYLFALYEDSVADLLVTGDKGVLAVELAGVTVVTPGEALRILSGDE